MPVVSRQAVVPVFLALVSLGYASMLKGWIGTAEVFWALAAALVSWAVFVQPKDLSRYVRPILRDADVLQHYDGATPFGDVRHKGRAAGGISPC